MDPAKPPPPESPPTFAEVLVPGGCGIWKKGQAHCSLPAPATSQLLQPTGGLIAHHEAQVYPTFIPLPLLSDPPL